MPDRLIRDELLESERWLWLPSDTDRIVFVGLLLRCDDFGNMEGGARRLFRFMQGFAQVRTEENAATVLLHLTDADLIRPYQVDRRDFLHVPRFRPHRQYLVRKVPASPWDSERKLGKNQPVKTRGLAKDHALGHEISNNMADICLPSAYALSQGVGVGVGVGVTQTVALSTIDPQPGGKLYTDPETLKFPTKIVGTVNPDEPTEPATAEGAKLRAIGTAAA